MKISAVISPKITKRNPELVIADKTNLFNFAVLALGLLSGATIYILAEDYLTGELWDYFVNFSTVFSSKSKIEILSGLLLINAPYILLMTIFGACIIGTPFIYAISFIKAMGLSLIPSHIYSNYGLKGIEYSIMVFFPGKFMLLLSMILLMYVCVNTSKNLYRASKGEVSESFIISKYLFKTVTVCVFFVFSALIEFLTIVAFSSLFSFT